MNGEIELKSCPCCGGDAEMMGDLYPYVECTECSLSFIENHQYDSDFESAAEQWNSRVSPKEDELAEENAVLRKMLDSTGRELQSVIERLNEYERKDFRCDQLDPPDLTDMQTVWEIKKMLHGGK